MLTPIIYAFVEYVRSRVAGREQSLRAVTLEDASAVIDGARYRTSIRRSSY